MHKPEIQQLTLFSATSVYTPEGQAKSFNPDNWETPDEVALFMSSLVPPGRGCEPSAGRGQIAQFLPKDTVCYEIDGDRAAVGKAKAPHCHWKVTSFFEQSAQFDWIIGNPPFSLWSDFVVHATNCLAEKGELILLIPTQRLSNQKDFLDIKMARLCIKCEYRIIGRIGFLREGKKPKNTDNYNTSIVVFQKTESSDFPSWVCSFVDPLNKLKQGEL